MAYANVAAGAPIYASTINDLIRASLNLPFCKVHQIVAQNLAATATDLILTHTFEEFDDYGWHDNTTNPSRIRPTIPGRYEVSVTGAIAGTNVIAAAFPSIYVNGAQVSRPGNVKPYYGTTPTGGNAPSTLSYEVGPWTDVLTLNGTTDYVEMALQASYASGTPTTNVSGSGRSTMSVKFLSAL